MQRAKANVQIRARVMAMLTALDAMSGWGGDENEEAKGHVVG